MRRAIFSVILVFMLGILFQGKAWHTVSAATNAENLAHAVNDAQQSPENVVLAWLLSPTHKANVMRKSCTSVGIAYYKGANGETYIVCEFN